MDQANSDILYHGTGPTLGAHFMQSETNQNKKKKLFFCIANFSSECRCAKLVVGMGNQGGCTGPHAGSGAQQLPERPHAAITRAFSTSSRPSGQRVTRFEEDATFEGAKLCFDRFDEPSEVPVRRINQV